jgi:hypothetical protein
MVEEIKLGRVGHYHTPDEGDGTCQTALVVHVWTPEMVNVVAFDGNGVPFGHTSAPVRSYGDPVGPSASFHLNRACPYER